MIRTVVAALATFSLAAAAFTSPAAASPDFRSSTTIKVADSPNDFWLAAPYDNSKSRVAAKASDIRAATFSIEGVGDDATLTVRIRVQRRLGRKFAYNQVVGLYADNFIYSVRSRGKATFTNTNNWGRDTCGRTASRRSEAVITITTPIKCVMGSLSTQTLNARTWIHRNPSGYTAGGDSTNDVILERLDSTVIHRDDVLDPSTVTLSGPIKNRYARTLALVGA